MMQVSSTAKTLQNTMSEQQQKQKDIQETAQQFEEFFARTLLKPYTESLSDSEFSMGNEWISSVLAQQIAKSNVLGIGQHVKDSLEK